MSLDLTPLDKYGPAAVEFFWGTRVDAAMKQQEGGKADQGERAGVTGGHNMDGFMMLLVELAKANGMPDAEIFTAASAVTLPGYFRPTKRWDLLIVSGSQLVAAIELKSQVGPSFGNNFNNRTEEAIGSAHDFWTAYREGAFGDGPRPFLGWLILVEDCEKSRAPGTRLDAPHFDVFPEFISASYLERYEILCRKLMLENLYTNAALVTSVRDPDPPGAFRQLSATTCLRGFASAFTGHVAAVVSSQGRGDGEP